MTLASGVRCIRLGGRLDSEASALHEAAILSLAVSSPGAVILDLEHLDFLGSSGLRVLLKCAKGQSALGGTVRLCRPNPFVREVLLVSEITEVLPVHASFAEARAQAEAEWSNSGEEGVFLRAPLEARRQRVDDVQSRCNGSGGMTA